MKKKPTFNKCNVTSFDPVALHLRDNEERLRLLEMEVKKSHVYVERCIRYEADSIYRRNESDAQEQIIFYLRKKIQILTEQLANEKAKY